MNAKTPSSVTPDERLRRTTVAGWIGTWALIVLGLLLAVARWRIRGVTGHRRARLQWDRLLTDEFAVQVKALLDSLDLQLRLLGLAAAVGAVVLADRMSKTGPRWLVWVAGAGAFAALAAALWDPTAFY